MINFAQISDQVASKIVSRLDNRNQDDKAIIAYGIHIILSNVIRTGITLVLVGLMGYLREYLFTLLLITALRVSMGGLHLENGIICFFTTWFYYSLPSGLASFNLIPRVPELYIAISIILLSLTYLYSPSDNQERPFLDPIRRLWLKRFSVLCVFITLLVNWYVVMNQFLFQQIIYTIILAIYLTLPITYRLYGRRYRNYDYVDDYVG